MNLAIAHFSPHLFWDVNKSTLEMEKHHAYIIRQVLEYGLLEDWELIKKHYGIARIAKTAVTFRELDAKTLSFISLLSHIPKEEFRCYTYQQSMPQHWNF